MTAHRRPSGVRRVAAALLGVRARVVMLLAAVAVLVGVGTGGVLALWSDAESVTGSMPVGVAVFGVGAPSALVYADQSTPDPGSTGRSTGTLTFELGPTQASALYNNNLGGAVAIVVQVDSLSQGHRGLAYELELDIVDGGIFDAATVTTYRVANVGACTTGLSGGGSSAWTPWPAVYSASQTLSTEYWCIVARYVPTTWVHENTATVTADNPTGPGTLQASDSWGATSAITFDPGLEPTHEVEFEFTTFRPGDTP